MPAPIRFGLRAQIVLALSVVFLISFALLGTATLRLTQAAGQGEQRRAARLHATALAIAVGQLHAGDDAAIDTVLDQLASGAPLRAIRIERADGTTHQRGRPPAEPGVSAPLPDGGRLTVWLEPAPARSRLPLGNLLLFYVLITGLAVLMLTYFSLTYWIVRPLDRLTLSSELLARGSPDVRVPERGAAEAVRLAAAFNHMAAQLRAERQALEQRLRELEQRTSELKQTQQQLIHGEKLASVGRLAAGIAHEIGNPLSAILGLVELLREGGLSRDEATEFLERIQRETERIHRIIRDLLDFSRRDVEDESAGQSSDLRQVIEDAVQLVRPQKESREIEIRVDVEAGLGRVVGPDHRLRQVVLNLLLNAVDALAVRGGGVIRIEARRRVEVGDCTLTVTDNGPGLPASVREHLFEPFTTTKPSGKGTGLGLAVCHALVEGMGGAIEAEDMPEGGARFRVQLLLSPEAVPRTSIGLISP
jgi:two-component system NtrC family sensor kinase